MKPAELIGHVDEQHRLLAELPTDIPPGPVKITGIRLSLACAPIATISSHGKKIGLGNDESKVSWMSTATYTAKDIGVLEGLEPVRKRPSMYIGGLDAKGFEAVKRTSFVRIVPPPIELVDWDKVEGKAEERRGKVEMNGEQKSLFE